MSAASPLGQQLYQVRVHNVEKGRQDFIGPAVSEPESILPLADAINRNVRAGREKLWREAEVVALPMLRS